MNFNGKAIIFDLDGTIVKTEHLWLQAALHLLEKRGISITQKAQEHLEQQLNGLDVLSACELIRAYFRLPDELQDLYKEKTELAHQLYTSLAFIPGFTEFHTSLQKNNISSAIATNSDLRTLKILNTALQLDSFFGNHIYSYEIVQKPKPQPDLFLYAAEQLKITPRNCIVIEDSAHGIQAAKAANMFCIGINSHGDTQQLKHADALANSYTDISTILSTKGYL